MEEVRDMLRRLLIAMGFVKTTMASNEEVALAPLTSPPFAIVLCDWGMLRVSGRTAREKVWADPKLSLPTALMITGETPPPKLKARSRLRFPIS